VPDDAPIPPTGRLGPASPPSYRPQHFARGGLDAGTRLLLVGAGFVLALLLLLVGGWAVSGRHGGGAVPLIEADKQPWRVKPDNPGGMEVVGASEKEGDVPGQPGATAPAPEAPAPEALRAAQPEPPPAPPLPPPEPATTTQLPASAAPGAPASPPAAALAPAASTAAPAAPEASPPAHPPVAQATGATAVQLAALGSEAGAHAEWQRLKLRMADVLGDRKPVIQRIDRDGHAIWRLRVGGFPSSADATRFCERVRAKAGACDLATF
jgi:cell division septation protein DedD